MVEAAGRCGVGRGEACGLRPTANRWAPACDLGRTVADPAGAGADGCYTPCSSSAGATTPPAPRSGRRGPCWGSAVGGVGQPAARRRHGPTAARPPTAPWPRGTMSRKHHPRLGASLAGQGCRRVRQQGRRLPAPDDHLRHRGHPGPVGTLWPFDALGWIAVGQNLLLGSGLAWFQLVKPSTAQCADERDSQLRSGGERCGAATSRGRLAAGVRFPSSTRPRG
jgi:hypothetical protein